MGRTSWITPEIMLALNIEELHRCYTNPHTDRAVLTLELATKWSLQFPVPARTGKELEKFKSDIDLLASVSISS